MHHLNSYFKYTHTWNETFRSSCNIVVFFVCLFSFVICFVLLLLLFVVADFVLFVCFGGGGGREFISRTSILVQYSIFWK